MVHVKRGNLTSPNREHIFHYAEVIDNRDPEGAGRIKARINLVDSGRNSEDLPWCFPLLPRFYNVVPKIGEGVRLLMYGLNKDKSDINRTYIGPLIGQDQDLLFQEKRSALGTQSDIGAENAKKSVETIKTAKGVYPKPGVVSIQGRDNSDIILDSAQVELRAGKFVPGNPIELNRKSPARVQLKLISENESVTNIISDKINLISYTGQPSLSFDTLQRNGLDSAPGKLQGFLQGNRPVYEDTNSGNLQFPGTLHPLVFGDKLISFLELVQKFVQNHTHPYGQMAPDVATDESDGIKKILEFNFRTMISHRIKIN